MEKYKESIISSHKQFNEERRLINLFSSINEKTKVQLQNETTQLLINSVYLSRFHYMILTSKLFEFEESVFPFQDIKIASIQTRKQLLGKADYYSYQEIIQYLFKNPTLFAQIIYFFLVNKNESSTANKFVLSEDDRAYFCFYTFPSMFTFFLTNQDRHNALHFIQSLFKLHFYLHDYQFSQSHLFLNDLIFSYFLTTNPTYFFENTVTPLLPDLIVDLPESSTAYVKTKEGHLIRRRYWLAIIKFVSELFTKMKDAIMLLSPQTLELITTIGSIECGTFPFRYLFIIDSMFCSYLQKFINIDKYNNLMKDVCAVIYCYFPQDKLPTPLYKEIKQFLKEDSIIDDFLNSIINKDNIDNTNDDNNNGLTIGLQTSKSSTYFTPRDFSLMYMAIKLFQNNCEPNLPSHFLNMTKSLEKPLQYSNDQQFISIDLTEKVSMLTQIDRNLTDPINNFIDILNLIDLSKFDFSTPEELKSIILDYGDCFLDVSQTCQILSRTDFLTGDIEMLNHVKEMRLKVSENSDKLYQGLIFVSRENEEKKSQKENLSTILANRIVVPLLTERYPIEFQFGPNDLLLVRATYSRFLKSISELISPLNLKAEYQFLIKRCFLFIYIDQIDIAVEFQKKLNLKQGSKPLENYKKNPETLRKLNSLTEHISELVNFAATLFQKVKASQKISENIVLVIRAMKVLEPFDDDLVKIAVSLALNPEVFGFSNFSKIYLIKEEVIKYIFDEEELKLLTRFQENLDSLKS